EVPEREPAPFWPRPEVLPRAPYLPRPMRLRALYLPAWAVMSWIIMAGGPCVGGREVDQLRPAGPPAAWERRPRGRSPPGPGPLRRDGNGRRYCRRDHR